MNRAIALSLLLLLCPPVRAQSLETSVSLLGGISAENWHGQVRVRAVNIEFARQNHGRTELAWVISPMQFEQPGNWFGDDFGPREDVLALSASLLLRRRYRTESARVQPYLELAGGPIWAETRVPAATSRFNFGSQGGFGVMLAPHSKLPVSIGYRFLHISNGGYAPRNPGLNVSALTIGFHSTHRPAH